MSLVWNNIWREYNKLVSGIYDNDIKLIAYYLPQFHPVEENNQWWGDGFTDWENVVQGRPCYKDHYQPHIPADLGFYDLRLPDVRRKQAEMAAKYGIYGFCYYYYWFDGHKILQGPIEDVTKSGEPDFPFCICWVNQSWKKTWYTRNEDVLLEIKKDAKSERKFIHSIIPMLTDKRYICVDGAPLLQIYRATNLADPAGTFKYWRDVCRSYGIPDLHICACDTKDTTKWAEIGFDSAAEFPPIGLHEYCPERKPEELLKDFTGRIHSYQDLVGGALERRRNMKHYYPGVAVAWDNTPRYRKRAIIFSDWSPEWYEVWLRAAIHKARATLPYDRRFVFLFAWNEWAEGAHLEPDRQYGHRLLEATQRALGANPDWRSILKSAQSAPAAKAGRKTDLLDKFKASLEWLANRR